MKSILGLVGLLFVLSAFTNSTFAFDLSGRNFFSAPVMGQGQGPINLPNGLKCLDKDKGAAMGPGNSRVLDWLKNTPNQFTARALVQGVVIQRYPDRTDHAHFAIDLNGDGKGDLEVIYQNGFGALPNIQPGTTVVACGDYITDHAHSPNGGIIHWVHCNPGDRDNGQHSHGFVMINGKVFGFQAPAGQPPCSLPSLR